LRGKARGLVVLLHTERAAYVGLCPTRACEA